jgi:hypothetical protein
MHYIRTIYLSHHSAVGGAYAWMTWGTPDAGKDPWNPAWAWG